MYDEERRVVVGAFEEMYRNEEREGYDPWHQEDLSQTWRALVLGMIGSRSPRSILDIGCGKGAFTQLFHAERVVGTDVSETAIAKARARCPHAEFRLLRAEEVATLDEQFDLAVCLETLSYVHGWRAFLGDLSRTADALVLSVYLPPTPPIGHVKSFDELREGLAEAWDVECEALVVDRDVNGSQLLVLADSRAAAAC